MPWEARRNVDDCDGWAVVKKGTDEVEGCHDSREEATEQIKALYASEKEGDKEEMAFAAGGARFEGMVHLEAKPTDDNRQVDENAIESRDPPLPLMWTDITGDGHYGARLAGTITKVERNGKEILIEGTFARNESGEQLRDALAQGLPLRPSVDLAVGEMEIIEDGEGQLSQHIHKARLVGVTLVPLPAQEGTWLKEISEDEEEEAKALAASAVQFDVLPHEWFEQPPVDGPTPFTLTDEGRVYGHAFLWEDCHTGHLNTCVKPPRSVTDYSYFRTGIVKTDKGETPVGQITLSGGHAGLKLDAKQTLAHYDDTKSAVADVNFGEDEWGGWFAGALRPGVSPDQIRTLQASALSGDWRPVREGLELIALLAVNTPGFPVRRVLVASGDVQSMIVSNTGTSFSVTPFSNLPVKSNRDTVWDGLAADKRVRKWASTDGSGARDKMNWSKYAKAHFWYDSSKPDKWASYKFNFADVEDGKLVAVARGVFAVAAAIQGARGGFKGIPENDIKAIKKNIDRYYSKIAAMKDGRDLKPPWHPDSEARTHGNKRKDGKNTGTKDNKDEQSAQIITFTTTDTTGVNPYMTTSDGKLLTTLNLLDEIVERPEIEKTLKELDAEVLSTSS